MSDLIERLRRYSYQQGTDDEQGKLIAELVGDMHQAADEIERLQAVVDAVKFHKNMMPSSVLRRLSALEDE